MKLRVIHTKEMPPFEIIRAGELWVSMRYKTAQLRCPCGCGELVVLSLSPSKWQITESVDGVTLDGSIQQSSECRSHYWIRDSEIVWCD